MSKANEIRYIEKHRKEYVFNDKAKNIRGKTKLNDFYIYVMSGMENKNTDQVLYVY